MNADDLKKQLLIEIDASHMRAMFPKFCSTFRDMIDKSNASESDTNIIKLFIEIFRNPDEWLASIAEHTSDYKIDTTT
jgi:hypothetical protein